MEICDDDLSRFEADGAAPLPARSYVKAKALGSGRCTRLSCL
jgi:hypothetical protein